MRKYRQADFMPVKFDSVRHALDMAVEECPDRDAYQFRVGNTDEIVHITFKQFYDETEALGSFLTSLGMGSAHIACCAENRYEWICAYITVLKSAGVYVPIDKELPSADKINVLTESDAEVLFFSKKYEKWVRENTQNLPQIKWFIGFDLEEDDGNILSYRKVLEIGAEMDHSEFDALKSDENDLKLLVYTSGTTGLAKGVMLSEHNLCSCVYYGMRVTHVYDKQLSVLPYHHTYEAVTDIITCIHAHSTLCINKSLKNLVKDMQLYQPTGIYLVPALAEFLYSSIMKNIKAQGKLESFEGAMKLSKAMRKVGIDLRARLFKEVRDVFGGKLIKIICGGAAIRPEIGIFFDTIGICLSGGYGITECSPLVATNDDETVTFDTVGHKLECLEWKIDEPNEEGIGEIVVKGDNVMLGYYKRPEATAEVLKDGWFYTGDYGYITASDELVITGRKKNIIVLNNGKNVYPEEIENYIQNIPCVEEIVVRSRRNEKGDESSLLAEVYLNEEKEEREVLKEIQKALSDLPSYKQITEVVIRKEPFPKTSTNKIKRNA